MRLLPAFLLFTCLGFGQNISVLTQHNNNYRTGWNNKETVLNHALISSGQFGCIGNFAVDDEVYAQPLVVSNMRIGNFSGAVLFVATVNNSLYAFNASDPSQATALWSVSLNADDQRSPDINDLQDAQFGRPCGGNYRDFSGRFGIVGTPVIDTLSSTLYVATKTIDQQGLFHAYINAIDIRTGLHKPGSPQLINAQVNGTGEGSAGGVVTYDAKYQNQRPSLLLHNNTVYVASASHCDWGPYHGWILGYDAASLALKYTYNATPNGWAAGIWMAGQGPSIGDDGNIYLSTGNGTTSPDNTDLIGGRSESLVKLSPQLKLLDWFTPANYKYLDDVDLDYGCDGVLMIPQTPMTISGSKEGISYVVDYNNMGRYNNANAQVKDTLIFNPNREGEVHVHGSPVYAKLQTGEYVYGWAESFKLRQVSFNRNTLRFAKTFLEGNRNLDNGMPGAMLSVSSNGGDTSSAIIWANFPFSGNANNQVRPGTIGAYNAANVSQPELWNSDNKVPDVSGKFAKFNCITVANGKVFAPTFSKNIKVYGKICENAIANLQYSNGSGLRGDYYSNISATDGFGTSNYVRLDETLNFNWANDIPAKNISKDVFKVRWTGKIEPLTSDTYTIYLTASDGVRLYLNDALLLDSWTDKTVTEHRISYAFDKSKKYDLRIEYYAGTNPAFINLQWGAPGICRQIIPASQLFASSANCNSNGTGLQAQYYTDINPQTALPANPTTSVLVPTVDFDWGATSPVGISNDNFKAVFTGYVQSLDAGDYTFYVTADDGIRLWLNNQLVIDKWIDQGATEYSYTINLKECTKTAIKIEYYENGGDAVCKLQWEGPAVGKQPIPTKQLFWQAEGPQMNGRSIVVYPNPVTGNAITVALDVPFAANCNASIYDAKGSLVKQQVVTNAQGNVCKIPVLLPRGLYMLKLNNAGKIYTTKFEVL